MSYRDLDLLEDASPSFRLTVEDLRELDFLFRAQLRETKSPTNADELLDARHQWATTLLMRVLLFDWNEVDQSGDWTPFKILLNDCFAVLKSCPESSYIDRGIDAAAQHMLGKTISLRFMVTGIIRNLWYLHDFRQRGKNNDPKPNHIGYYYQTLTVMTMIVRTYLYFANESARKSKRDFSPLTIEG